MNQTNLPKHSERGRSKWLHDFTRQRHRVQGGALPKVRTGFEDAHRFSKVRILENPGDLFEDAHPFPRCARKVRTFAERRAAVLQSVGGIRFRGSLFPKGNC